MKNKYYTIEKDSERDWWVCRLKAKILIQINHVDSLELLRQITLEKWTLLAEFYEKYPKRKMMEGGSASCVYCELFSQFMECPKCPVAQKDKSCHCKGSLYYKYRHFKEDHSNIEIAGFIRARILPFLEDLQ